MRKIRTLSIIIVLALILAQLSILAPAAAAQADEDRTPFQQWVMETIAQRNLQGLPVPSNVSFEYNFDSDIPASILQEGDIIPGAQFTITAKTVIDFDNPQQAGNEKWPDLVVESENYSQFIKQKVEEEYPSFWDEHEFGYEPRTLIVSEELKITYPEVNGELGTQVAEALSTSTFTDEILMGFTVTAEDLGIKLDYSQPWDWYILGVKVIDFWAGIYLDWGLGLRLPMEVSLTSTDPMTEGSTYSPTSKVTGLDWSAADFSEAGVAPEDGNEFVMRFEFSCGVYLWVPIVGNIIDEVYAYQFDESRSFATPFGPGATFELPTINIPLWYYEVFEAYVEIGLSLTPYAGSEKFTASWAASGDASGSGSLTYTDPAVPVQLGSVNAIDGPGYANIMLNDFRYYFTTFVLDLGMYLYLDVFGVWDGYPLSIPLADFDLSVITGHLYVNVHSGSEPDALEVSIEIQNVPPTAEIDRGGTVEINGVPTFMAHSGDQLTFTGHATDPGQDDLTLSWDWDDGPPSPDTSKTYPVPYDVTESQTHTFTKACMYMVGFKAMDDDLAFSEDHVPVIITETGNRARLEGYWQHQLRGNGKTDFDTTALENYLSIVGHMSTVFNEARDASTIEKAHDVLFLKQNKGSTIEQLDRELLVVWLNFANGAIEYMELVDSDLDGIVDTPFADVVAAAEVVRLDPDATKEEIKRQTQILHHVSEMAE